MGKMSYLTIVQWIGLLPLVFFCVYILSQKQSTKTHFDLVCIKKKQLTKVAIVHTVFNKCTLSSAEMLTAVASIEILRITTWGNVQTTGRLLCPQTTTVFLCKPFDVGEKKWEVGLRQQEESVFLSLDCYCFSYR